MVSLRTNTENSTSPLQNIYLQKKNMVRGMTSPMSFPRNYLYTTSEGSILLKRKTSFCFLIADLKQWNGMIHAPKNEGFIY